MRCRAAVASVKARTAPELAQVLVGVGIFQVEVDGLLVAGDGHVQLLLVAPLGYSFCSSATSASV
jgi:hypothetical protein